MRGAAAACYRRCFATPVLPYAALRAPLRHTSPALSVYNMLGSARNNHNAPYLHDDGRLSTQPFQTAAGFVTIPKNQHRIYYEVYRLNRPHPHAASQVAHNNETLQSPHPVCRVVMVMGMGAACIHWLPFISCLAAQMESNSSIDRSFELLVFDNRGHGRSSVMPRLRDYSIPIMVEDTMTLMDHLKWGAAHLVGHSMGGMIALKAGALYPERVLSVTAISVTAGGLQMLPATARGWKYLLLGACASSAQALNSVYVNFHFSERQLEAQAPDGRTYHDVLLDEYIDRHFRDGPSHKDGEAGQIWAILRNKLSKKEVKVLRSGQFPVSLIHGYDDILADHKHAVKLARRLHTTCTLLPGGHLITRERVTEVVRLWLQTSVHRESATAPLPLPAAGPAGQQHTPGNTPADLPPV